eukprot:CAMPEP_0118852492 /NCGR_PEP_ID=MMETSP1163-20130328/1473_1 /TAXON_ID=124430 /ORGANISM="Phaeomonas parva, Strain CCMP2877" /LENGTH=176 /DNA_ID=CAMNT_0006784925 /DNA_START=162 /DNA_END=689 /DNA_ORIENTATION=-
MAELLLKWVNEEGRLGRAVTDLEHDFKNGYLLGELLYQYNQLPNFPRMQDKHSPDVEISNYCILEPVMRSLGIPFDAKTAQRIMDGKAGVASGVIYQLKVKFETMQRGCAPVSLRKMQEGVVPLPMMRERHAKPSYDAASHRVFEGRIRRLVPKANELLETRCLSRFSAEGQRQHE